MDRRKPNEPGRLDSCRRPHPALLESGCLLPAAFRVRYRCCGTDGLFAVSCCAPCGRYPRCEVSAVAAGSVREAGPKRRAHPLLLSRARRLNGGYGVSPSCWLVAHGVMSG